MPRRTRIHIDGLPLHIVQRGHNRAACFFDDQDRRAYLGWLHEALARERCRLHAYVLMTNHVHLLMTAERDAGVPAVMKHLGQRYVQYVNRTYRRTGGLFEGRFRSAVIEADPYLLACQRYIELNPVRAAMVAAPGDFFWSSYRANALGERDPVVTPHPVYRDLASSDDARLAAYRRLFAGELSIELLQRLRDCTNGGFVVGRPQFERQIAAMVGRRTWKGSPGRPPKETDVGAQTELAF